MIASRRPRLAPPPLAITPLTSAQWVATYRHCRFATPADNDDLLAISRAVAMKAGALSISYSRAPDYFAAAKESGAFPFVVLMRNPDGSAAGTMSVITRDALRDGRKMRYGYACDLRVLPGMSRETWKDFARCYVEAVRYVPGIEEAGAPEVFLTTVIDQNERALRLLRTRMPGLTYLPIEAYRVVQSFFRLRPTIERAIPGVTIRRASAADAPAIRALLAADAAKRPLADDDLERRFSAWGDFSWSSFFVAEHAERGLVGCVAPRENRTRKAVLTGLTPGQRFASRFLPRPIVDGEPMDVLYLTHLVADDARIQRAFLLRAHEERRARGAHAVAWIEWPRFAETVIDTRGFACVRTNGTLYQVALQDRPAAFAPFSAAPQLDVSTL